MQLELQSGQLRSERLEIDQPQKYQLGATSLQQQI